MSICLYVCVCQFVYVCDYERSFWVQINYFSMQSSSLSETWVRCWSSRAFTQTHANAKSFADADQVLHRLLFLTHTHTLAIFTDIKNRPYTQQQPNTLASTYTLRHTQMIDGCQLHNPHCSRIHQSNIDFIPWRVHTLSASYCLSLHVHKLILHLSESI